MDIITLENDALRLEFARDNAALVGFTAKATGWEIISRPSSWSVLSAAGSAARPPQ